MSDCEIEKQPIIVWVSRAMITELEKEAVRRNYDSLEAMLLDKMRSCLPLNKRDTLK